MLELLRRLKITYSLYNFFHRNDLKHNEALFRKYGLNKRYFSPISSKDFKNIDPKLAENAANPAAIKKTRLFQNATAADQQSILDFEKNGYLILRNYLTPGQVEEVNKTIDQLLANGTVAYRYRNKIMFAIHLSPLLKNIGEEKKLTDFLSTLVGGEVTLFQSINFLMGSEQHTHSDSIHMTTYPLGGLLGVWIALDDITTENGPLHYYPGSHKLPYYLNSDYDNEGSALLIGDKSYEAYEEMIAGKIEEKGIKKEIFTANKGDLLVWHANLFHGGEPHKDKSLTRKSMVFHYFKKDSICYHEITQRPALMKNQH